MNFNKRLAYGAKMTQIGIHTGNGTTQNIVDLDKASGINIIENCNIRKIRNVDMYETYMRVNPNKNNSGYILTEYSKFKNVMQGMFDELGVSNFEWKRIDLSFNTLDTHYYENYTKLNRLLIACLANSSNDYNTYDTRNFWNGKTKSLVTKNGYREMEFYDKNDESNSKSPYYSRLELRSLRIRGSIKHEFLEVWFERLDKAAQQFEKVQDRFNQSMRYLKSIKQIQACYNYL